MKKKKVFSCLLRIVLFTILCFGVLWINACPGIAGEKIRHPRVDNLISLEQLRIQHQAVLAEMSAKDKDGKAADLDDPKMPGLLKRGWSLAGMWAAEYFESHSRPSNRDLEKIFDDFAPEPKGYKSKYGDFLEYQDYRLMGNAVRIGSDVYVVTASYVLNFPSTGTFMIVARNREGRFQALWNIKDIAEKHYAQKDELGRWMHLTRKAYYNGPLNVGTIIPLPVASSGHLRFLVDAFQSAHGSMQLSQLSIWEWNGIEAKLLLIGLYQNALDYGGLKFHGDLLRILTKEETATFFTTSPDPEPRGIWTIRIDAKGVQDLGHRFVKTEIQWADELFSKISKGKDTINIADARVAATIRTRMQEIQKQMQDEHPSMDLSSFFWGELWKCKILRRGQSGAFELTMDEGKVRLRYNSRNGKPYFTDVRIE
jgi:hypothetical protein